MLQGLGAIYLREMIILKRRLPRLLATMSVSPLLYLVAFSYAMGTETRVDGHTYQEFLIPGLVAMSSMTQAWAIASEINIARFYWHVFEEFQSAPLSNLVYVMGEVLAALTRTMIAVGIIIAMGLAFGVVLTYNPWFWLAILLNAMVFASLAVCSAMLVKSHADQAMITSFVITPMALLGGTVFPVERLPEWAGQILQLLPLSHASRAIRSSALGGEPAFYSYILLAMLGMVCFFSAVHCVNRARD
jgi:ABC-2 type transport system permease protein